MPIDRQSVRSSSLASVGYSEDARTLEVEFRGDRVYRYSNVPAGVYEELMRDSSMDPMVRSITASSARRSSTAELSCWMRSTSQAPSRSLP